MLHQFHFQTCLSASKCMVLQATGSLKHQAMMQGLKNVVVNYCMYSDFGYKKSTMLWFLGSKGFPDFRPKICVAGGRCESFTTGRHPNTFSGKSKQIPLADKYRVPQMLIEDLLQQAKEQVYKSRDEQAMSL